MRAKVLFHLLVKVFFQSRKGAAAYDVLDFAGVVCRGFLVDAEPDEELTEHGVTLVGALSDLKPRLGEVKSPVVGNGDVAAVTENSDRTADAGLGVAHFLADVDRAHKSLALTENIYGFKIHFA